MTQWHIIHLYMDPFRKTENNEKTQNVITSRLNIVDIRFNDYLTVHLSIYVQAIPLKNIILQLFVFRSWTLLYNTSSLHWTPKIGFSVWHFDKSTLLFDKSLMKTISPHIFL